MDSPQRQPLPTENTGKHARYGPELPAVGVFRCSGFWEKGVSVIIKQLKNIVRKDVPIYYKMFYNAVAEIELPGQVVEAAIEFSLEMKPTGVKEIVLSVEDYVDYPLVPLMTALKTTILALDRDAKLPL
jgi:hypothetical protein